jgi:hypothetical protein
MINMMVYSFGKSLMGERVTKQQVKIVFDLTNEMIALTGNHVGIKVGHDDYEVGHVGEFRHIDGVIYALDCYFDAEWKWQVEKGFLPYRSALLVPFENRGYAISQIILLGRHN